MIGGGEHHQRAFEVVVLRIEAGRGLRRGTGRALIHTLILSYVPLPRPFRGFSAERVGHPITPSLDTIDS